MYSINLQTVKISNLLPGMSTWAFNPDAEIFSASQEVQCLSGVRAKLQSPSLWMIAKVCLVTGMRWSEVENLQGHQLSKYRITYTTIKGKKNLTVPISQDLYDELPKNRGKLFTPCRKAFERAVKRADIDLPEGEYTHVLHHNHERGKHTGTARYAGPCRHQNDYDLFSFFS